MSTGAQLSLGSFGLDYTPTGQTYEIRSSTGLVNSVSSGLSGLEDTLPLCGSVSILKVLDACHVLLVDSRIVRLKPVFVDILSEEDLLHLNYGCSEIAEIVRCNDILYTSQSHVLGQNYDTSYEDSLVDVQIGEGFYVCLSAKGFVFAFGKNQYGQLGLGHTRDVFTPTLVRALVRETSPNAVLAATQFSPVRSIAAGQHHVVASTHEGLVFSWGRAEHGQTGIVVNSIGVNSGAKLISSRGTILHQQEPAQLVQPKVQSLQPIQPTPKLTSFPLLTEKGAIHASTVYATGTYSVSVFADGRVFYWGSGLHKTCFIPELLYTFGNNKVSVKLGNSHALFLHKKCLYGVGYNTNRQMPGDYRTMTLITQNVKRISASNGVSAYSDFDDVWYVCGNNTACKLGLPLHADVTEEEEKMSEEGLPQKMYLEKTKVAIPVDTQIAQLTEKEDVQACEYVALYEKEQEYTKFETIYTSEEQLFTAAVDSFSELPLSRRVVIDTLVFGRMHALAFLPTQLLGTDKRCGHANTPFEVELTSVGITNNISCVQWNAWNQSMQIYTLITSGEYLSLSEAECQPEEELQQFAKVQLRVSSADDEQVLDAVVENGDVHCVLPASNGSYYSLNVSVDGTFWSAPFFLPLYTTLSSATLADPIPTPVLAAEPRMLPAPPIDAIVSRATAAAYTSTRASRFLARSKDSYRVPSPVRIVTPTPVPSRTNSSVSPSVGLFNTVRSITITTDKPKTPMPIFARFRNMHTNTLVTVDEDTRAIYQSVQPRKAYAFSPEHSLQQRIFNARSIDYRLPPACVPVVSTSVSELRCFVPPITDEQYIMPAGLVSHVYNAGTSFMIDGYTLKDPFKFSPACQLQIEMSYDGGYSFDVLFTENSPIFDNTWSPVAVALTNPEITRVFTQNTSIPMPQPPPLWCPTATDVVGSGLSITQSRMLFPQDTTSLNFLLPGGKAEEETLSLPTSSSALNALVTTLTALTASADAEDGRMDWCKQDMEDFGKVESYQWNQGDVAYLQKEFHRTTSRVPLENGVLCVEMRGCTLPHQFGIVLRKKGSARSVAAHRAMDGGEIGEECVHLSALIHDPVYLRKLLLGVDLPCECCNTAETKPGQTNLIDEVFCLAAWEPVVETMSIEEALTQAQTEFASLYGHLYSEAASCSEQRNRVREASRLVSNTATPARGHKKPMSPRHVKPTTTSDDDSQLLRGYVAAFHQAWLRRRAAALRADTCVDGQSQLVHVDQHQSFRQLLTQPLETETRTLVSPQLVNNVLVDANQYTAPGSIRLRAVLPPLPWASGEVEIAIRLLPSELHAQLQENKLYPSNCFCCVTPAFRLPLALALPEVHGVLPSTVSTHSSSSLSIFGRDRVASPGVALVTHLCDFSGTTLQQHQAAHASEVATSQGLGHKSGSLKSQPVAMSTTQRALSQYQLVLQCHQLNEVQMDVSAEDASILPVAAASSASVSYASHIGTDTRGAVELTIPPLQTTRSTLPGATPEPLPGLYCVSMYPNPATLPAISTKLLLLASIPPTFASVYPDTQPLSLPPIPATPQYAHLGKKSVVTITGSRLLYSPDIKVRLSLVLPTTVTIPSLAAVRRNATNTKTGKKTTEEETPQRSLREGVVPSFVNPVVDANVDDQSVTRAIYVRGIWRALVTEADIVSFHTGLKTVLTPTYTLPIKISSNNNTSLLLSPPTNSVCPEPTIVDAMVLENLAKLPQPTKRTDESRKGLNTAGAPSTKGKTAPHTPSLQTVTLLQNLREKNVHVTPAQAFTQYTQQLDASQVSVSFQMPSLANFGPVPENLLAAWIDATGLTIEQANTLLPVYDKALAEHVLDPSLIIQAYNAYNANPAVIATPQPTSGNTSGTTQGKNATATSTTLPVATNTALQIGTETHPQIIQALAGLVLTPMSLWHTNNMSNTNSSTNLSATASTASISTNSSNNAKQMEQERWNLLQLGPSAMLCKCSIKIDVSLNGCEYYETGLSVTLDTCENSIPNVLQQSVNAIAALGIQKEPSKKQKAYRH